MWEPGACFNKHDGLSHVICPLQNGPTPGRTSIVLIETRPWSVSWGVTVSCHCLLCLALDFSLMI